MTPMKDLKDNFAPDFTGLERDDWLDALKSVVEEHGYFEPLSSAHSVTFLDGSPTLLVTFESIPEIANRTQQRLPRGFDFVTRRGWSHLSIIAHEPGWFRDARLYRYFDRLVDDGFFEGFDKVLFFGQHQGGYAAAAYSVAAPGARVLLLRPVATLDPEVTGFDSRYKADRRTVFTDRYGYAPDMIDAANRAWVIYDPTELFDSMQAALFTRPNVQKFKCPGLGSKLDTGLDQVGALNKLISAAMSGELDSEAFGQIWRDRHDSAHYLRGLVAQCEKQGRLGLALRVCDTALARDPHPFFAKRREAIEKRLAAAL